MLACDADALMVGLPGLALPDSALATAMLPSVPDMAADSLRASSLARKLARPARACASAQPAGAPFLLTWKQCLCVSALQLQLVHGQD